MTRAETVAVGTGRAGLTGGSFTAAPWTIPAGRLRYGFSSMPLLVAGRDAAHVAGRIAARTTAGARVPA